MESKPAVLKPVLESAHPALSAAGQQQPVRASPAVPQAMPRMEFKPAVPTPVLESADPALSAAGQPQSLGRRPIERIGELMSIEPRWFEHNTLTDDRPVYSVGFLVLPTNTSSYESCTFVQGLFQTDMGLLRLGLPGVQFFKDLTVCKKLLQKFEGHAHGRINFDPMNWECFHKRMETFFSTKRNHGRRFMGAITVRRIHRTRDPAERFHLLSFTLVTTSLLLAQQYR